jgi:alkylation response protein AidB-like acyl-CoA dehydrogenase
MSEPDADALPPFYDDDHTAFREVVREYVVREVVPHQREWDQDHAIPRSAWLAAGRQGILGIRFPEEFDGGGMSDFRYRCVVHDEFSRVGAAALASSFAINEDIVSGYLLRLGTDAQRKTWLPGMAVGQVVVSIAMSEPAAGSDLRGIQTSAVHDGSDWVLNGSKTFITNGHSSDVVLVAARTGERDGRPTFSLLLVPTTTPGFSRGRKLAKMGLDAQDTAELYFDDVRVPAENLVGEEGRGLHHLMDQLPVERLSIAWRGIAAAQAALDWTIEYASQRKAFGQRVIDFQNTRFRLAELATEVEITRGWMEQQVLRFNAGLFDATTGAMAKWWTTELQKRVVDTGVQVHGGYGYMEEYPISRAYRDTRVQTLVGGTTEVMKEIIGRSLAKRHDH